jgi:hypothetical protein
MVNIKTTSQNLSPKPIPWKKAYNSTLPKNINIKKMHTSMHEYSRLPRRIPYIPKARAQHVHNLKNI